MSPACISTPSARSIAAGDRARRGPIDAPGEVGELAQSLGDLSAQLAARDAARDSYESLLVELIEALNEGVVGVDGARQVMRVNDTARRLLGVSGPAPFSTDLLPRDPTLRAALDALRGADALVIAADWPEFRSVDLAAVRAALARGLVVDGRNLLDPAAARAAGLDYVGIGR